jgi:putative ABC transport system permease protein
MFKAVIKGLLAHKLRLLLTGLAIVLGIGFVSGTYVLTDTMNKAFDNLFTDVTRGVDVFVSAKDNTESQTSFSPPGIPESVLGTVEGVDGVQSAEGSVDGFAQMIDKEGEAIVPNGPPSIGTTFLPDDESSEVSSGRPPMGLGEVAVDFATAEDHGFEVGDEIQIVFESGSRSFEIVGIAGSEDSAGMDLGATVALFDLETAQRVLGSRGEFSQIRIAGSDGVSDVELAARVSEVLPSGFEAATGTQTAEEQSTQIKQALSFFNVTLLAFAAIALFVGAFLIFNTFSVVVAQRTREYALLRTLGATGGQITRSVFIEALLVGLVFSAVGIGAGFLIALGLGAVLSAFGIDLPTTDLVMLPRTVIVGLVVGTLVTVVASVAPARRASRVSPMAALRETTPASGGWSRRRALAGVVVAIAGAALLWVGLTADLSRPIVAVGAGAALVFIGVAILGPLFAGPLSSVVGFPVRGLLRVPGKLAQQNAGRNPKRTAATASALMIGVALVSMISVLAASLKASTAAALEKNLRADFIVTTGSTFGGSPISARFAESLRGRPEIAAVSPLRLGAFREKGTLGYLAATDVASIDQTMELGVEEGDTADLQDGGIFISRTTADARDVQVGDELNLRFDKTGTVSSEIEGIFANKDVVQTNYLMSLQEYDRNFTDRLDFMVFVATASGSTQAEARAAIESAAESFPSVNIADQGEFREQQEQSINQLLGLLTALLGLALFIAVLGITNTLALAVFERTRELGLLRAVGMTKRQTRSMIRWESVIVAVIGAIMGMVVGCFFGWALVRALESEGITELAVPGGQLALYGIAAAIAGVLAGLPPARSAARLDVLKAVATE